MWFFGSSGDSHFLTKFWYFAKFGTMKFLKQPRHQMWTSENFNFGRYSTLWEDVSVGKSNLDCLKSFLAAKRFWKVWIETAASERRLWMSHCMKMFSINVLLSIDTHSWFAKVNGGSGLFGICVRIKNGTLWSPISWLWRLSYEAVAWPIFNIGRMTADNSVNIRIKVAARKWEKLGDFYIFSLQITCRAE